MSKTVDNLYVTWVRMGVKNVFKVVDTSLIILNNQVARWNNRLYPSFCRHLPTIFIHRKKLSITSIKERFMPIIHRTYNNQLEGKYNKKQVVGDVSI